MKEFDPNLINPLILEALNYPTHSNYPPGRDTGVAWGVVMLGLVIALKAKRVVELGVRGGGSAYPLLLGTQLTRGELVSVDIKEPDRSWADNIKLGSHWRTITSDSIEYLKSRKEPIDLVFVDDWHEYSHVVQQLEILKDLVSPSGLILIHDAMYQNWEPKYHENLEPVCPRFGEEFGNGGVYRALKTFTSKYTDEWEYVTIPVDHGLTILRKVDI